MVCLPLETTTKCHINLPHFFFRCNSVLRLNIIQAHVTGQSVGGRNQENPEKKHLAHPLAELGLSHVPSVGNHKM